MKDFGKGVPEGERYAGGESCEKEEWKFGNSGIVAKGIITFSVCGV